MTTKRYEITALAYNKRGKLLAVGKNSYVKTHPMQARFAKESHRPGAIFLHAEVDALLKSTEPVHTLVVTRYDSEGNPKLAKPCKACQLAIKYFKVKKVEHT